MKKMNILIMAVLVLLWSGTLSSAQAETVNKGEVKLTQQQKEELSALHRNILAEKKKLITKYVEYGILTEEKGKKILTRLEEHYSMLEKEGFVPQHKMGRDKWKHHHPNHQNRP
ncbi:hypothetical protein JOC77_003283 [Peribacillus deserti]|uniref:DUF2680 domain-containing protein n=1 Tax=Peribacillus deserti TaxID=673318 RepID=A0ABS2QM53_9BACI|nr:YckD family protein [Peribacillus deserti]MBM7693839.1 hypothetical protein [Peribacillus deserti]